MCPTEKLVKYYCSVTDLRQVGKLHSVDSQDVNGLSHNSNSAFLKAFLSIVSIYPQVRKEPFFLRTELLLLCRQHLSEMFLFVGELDWIQ